MRLKKEQVDKIAGLIFKNLKDKKLIAPRVPEAQIQGRISEIILSDFKAEEDLEKEVYQKMDQYRSQIDSGSLDERKVFMMIKKQLAQQKKMVL